jgi:hypothetical protein
MHYNGSMAPFRLRPSRIFVFEFVERRLKMEGVQYNYPLSKV